MNSHVTRLRSIRSLTLQSLMAVLFFCAALALPNSAMAGTASSSEVLKLVNQSSGISALTTNQIRGLEALTKDLPWRIYAATPGQIGCATLSSCTFGPKTSKKLLVILGDSHAMMWIPAILPNAIKLGYKISLVWEPACPIASLSVAALYPPDFRPNHCATWLSSTLTSVAKAAPQAIILGERSARVVAQGGTSPFSSAAWQSGLETTINALKGIRTKIALLGDIPYLSRPTASCLAIQTKSVQLCGSAYPSPDFPGQQIAEAAAASSTGSTYVSTIPWFCTKTCSPVIGKYFAYYDQGHVSTTYALYLSGVMTAALNGVL